VPHKRLKSRGIRRRIASCVIFGFVPEVDDAAPLPLVAPRDARRVRLPATLSKPFTVAPQRELRDVLAFAGRRSRR
jgi:hypothetical protein